MSEVRQILSLQHLVEMLVLRVRRAAGDDGVDPGEFPGVFVHGVFEGVCAVGGSGLFPLSGSCHDSRFADPSSLTF